MSILNGYRYKVNIKRNGANIDTGIYVVMK